jgi:hypothetical protein
MISPFSLFYGIVKQGQAFVVPFWQRDKNADRQFLSARKRPKKATVNLLASKFLSTGFYLVFPTTTTEICKSGCKQLCFIKVGPGYPALTKVLPHGHQKNKARKVVMKKSQSGPHKK